MGDFSYEREWMRSDGGSNPWRFVEYPQWKSAEYNLQG